MTDLSFKRAQIKIEAKNAGLKLVFYNPQKELYQFYNEQENCFIDIWARSFKIATCMNRKPFGYSSLLREKVGILDMKNIFQNPRFHTDKGRRL